MMSPSENRLFLRKFLQYPKQVGSIVPSSKYLAAMMVGAVPWREVAAIAELGAGTGAITRYITQKAGEHVKVYAFEKDAKMRRMLQQRFPRIACAANAVNLTRILENNGEDQLDCILSGLPFYNFPPQLRDRILGQVAAGLKPGGLFVAFQYSLQMRKHLAERFVIERIGFVPFNFPPAFVYVCRNRNENRRQ